MENCTVVVDTGGVPWHGSISANFQKNSKWLLCYFQGLGGSWFRKNLKQKISWHSPFNGTRKNNYLPPMVNYTFFLPSKYLLQCRYICVHPFFTKTDLVFTKYFCTFLNFESIYVARKDIYKYVSLPYRTSKGTISGDRGPHPWDNKSFHISCLLNHQAIRYWPAQSQEQYRFWHGYCDKFY